MPDKKVSANDLLKRAYNLQSAEESKALYKDWAGTYDETMLEGLGYLTPSKTAQLLAEFIPEKNVKILDVGSGTGLAGAELVKLGFSNIDALDYSAEMLAVAAERKIYTGFHEVDLREKIPLETDSYDAMICTGTFTHAHVGAGCLDELFRMLRPGGKFACTVHMDIWEKAGFGEKTSTLEADNVVRTLYRELGTYFEGENPEGWFIVWEKLD